MYQKGIQSEQREFQIGLRGYSILWNKLRIFFQKMEDEKDKNKYEKYVEKTNTSTSSYPYLYYLSFSIVLLTIEKKGINNLLNN